jgi:hypothetical protein
LGGAETIISKQSNELFSSFLTVVESKDGTISVASAFAGHQEGIITRFDLMDMIDQ